MANNKAGLGTTFTLGGATIGKIKDISGPPISRTAIDITTLDSVDGWMESMPGQRDGGDVSFTILYNMSSSADLALRENFDLDNMDAVVPCSINFVGGSSLSFSGSVSSLGFAIPMDDVITQDVSIKTSGKINAVGSF